MNLFREIDSARERAAARHQASLAGEVAALTAGPRPHLIVRLLNRLSLAAIPLFLVLGLLGRTGELGLLAATHPFIAIGALLQLLRWLTALRVLPADFFGRPVEPGRTLTLNTAIWLLGLAAIWSARPELLGIFWLIFLLRLGPLIHRLTMRVMEQRELLRLRGGAEPAERLSE